MSFDIGDALEDGVERTVATNGLQFAAIFAVISIASTLLVADIAATVLEQLVEEGTIDEVPSGNPMLGDDPTDPILGLPLAASVAVLVALTVVQIVVSIAAARTFASDVTEHIPREFLTRRLGWAVLNLFVGGIVFGILVSIGFVLFILPGVFLLVTLFFWWLVVVVEDENFVEGFSRSWSLTKGDRLELFLLGLVVTVLSGVINGLSNVFTAVGPRLFVVVVTALLSAPVFVFSTATAASAYRQLQDDSPTSVEEEYVEEI